LNEDRGRPPCSRPSSRRWPVYAARLEAVKFPAVTDALVSYAGRSSAQPQRQPAAAHRHVTPAPPPAGGPTGRGHPPAVNRSPATSNL
jgi:hypothetical protein